MATRSTLTMSQEQQEKALFLFVVVVGYLVTFTVASNGGTRYSIPQLRLGIVFGVIYLTLGFSETEILRPFSANTKNAIFLPVQNLMVFGIGWILDPDRITGLTPVLSQVTPFIYRLIDESRGCLQ